MRFASICSGIEAASVAWKPLGWEAAWLAELDAFPSAVLAHHYPDVPNLGDVTKITESEANAHGPIDVVIGGTPCQSYSSAGNRKGMDDERGKLATALPRIAAGVGAEWLVWENVPGCLSTNDGRDFGTFLGTLAEFGYGFAYRVLDAQYFGVPQRRRRVFVVGCSRGRWQRAAAVLFERESLCRDLTPSRAEGEGSSGSTSDGAGILFDRAQITSGVNRANPKAGDPSPTIMAASQLHYVTAFHAMQDPITSPVSLPLDTCGHSVGVNVTGKARRLLPVEWERLQGFPDGYTAIHYKGKPAADGPRYKAIGNSMAVPVIRWIGERIAMVNEVTQ